MLALAEIKKSVLRHGSYRGLGVCCVGIWPTAQECLRAVSVVNSLSVSCRATSRTPTVGSSRNFCEIVCLLKMKLSLYQDDFNIEPVILWIHPP